MIKNITFELKKKEWEVAALKKYESCAPPALKKIKHVPSLLEN